MRIDWGVAPTDLPVPDASIATHFAMLGADGDTVAAVRPYVAAAAETVSRQSGVALLDRAVTVEAPKWPAMERQDQWWSGVREAPVSLIQPHLGPLSLPIGPLADPGRFTITFVAGDGAEVTRIAADGYRVVTGRDPAIHPHDGTDIPTGSAVRITYTAGFGPTHATVPPDLAHAVLDQALHLYEHRGGGGAPGLSGVVRATAARWKRGRI